MPKTICANCGADLAYEPDNEEPVLILFGCTGPADECPYSVFGVKKFLTLARRRLLMGRALPELPAS